MYSITELYVFMGAGVIVGYILGYGYQKLKLIMVYRKHNKFFLDQRRKEKRRLSYWLYPVVVRKIRKE